jgi:oxygen-dependent protoporphyrinogen oxidase
LKISIIGAGISGLATAKALLDLQPNLELELFESRSRSGGKVWTEHTPEGFICEGGVNGFLNNKPLTLELAGQLGLRPVQGADAANRRYVFRKNQLHQLPETPLAFLRSGLMSFPGRLRVGLEPFISKGGKEDETLADFGTRRLGKEAFEALIDPMASGVFAGDARTMSLKSCFPRINEIETEYGSLIRGMLRLQFKARREGTGKGPGPGPGGHLTSFDQGMSEMTDTLAGQLGDRVKLNAPVESIDRQGNRFLISFFGGASSETDVIVLATPAYVQGEILQDMAPDIALLLNGIDYPPLSVVCTGYRAEDMSKPVDGFGFLIPSSEKRDILGTVFDSNVFPNRAPQGSILLRSMVGGSRNPGAASLNDQELTSLVQNELKSIAGINTEPDFVRIYRHKRAIPQYHIGHAQKLSAIDQALHKHSGLTLTGNAFKGVSLNDCIQNAQLTAQTILN